MAPSKGKPDDEQGEDQPANAKPTKKKAKRAKTKPSVPVTVRARAIMGAIGRTVVANWPLKPKLPLYRYKSLMIFWAVLIGAVLGGAAWLQSMGPVPHASQWHEPVAVNPDAPVPVRKPDPALAEAAPTLPGRQLPRIAPDGRMSQDIYGAHANESDKRARIALVVAGIGLSQDLSRRVLNDLPAAVTIAFSAYAPEDQANSLDADSRALGHECLVSVPLEPHHAPRDDAGNRALLTTADPRQNAQNLEWALSRRMGCIGMTALSDGFLGEVYLQNLSLYADLLREIGNRGLLWLDPRPGTVLPDVPGDPAGRLVADIVIDAPDDHGDPPDQDLIDQRLNKLFVRAQSAGTAIGVIGLPHPLVIARLQRFIEIMRNKKTVALVPLSAMPKGNRL